MTKEEIKNLLENYKFEVEFYKKKREEANIIKESHSKTIQLLKEFNQGDNNQMIADIILKYTKELLENENKLAQLYLHMQKIEALLENVSQPYRTVLHYKYILGHSIEKIAENMNYSTQRINQFHDSGMKQILGNQEKDDAV